jgi:hypothetical protein
MSPGLCLVSGQSALPDCYRSLQETLGLYAERAPMTLSEIEDRLLRVLARCTGLVEEQRLNDDRSLTMAGEPGVALENLCEQLLDQDAAVSAELLDELEKLGKAMGLNERYWNRLPRK